jgi:hypothetical protein
MRCRAGISRIENGIEVPSGAIEFLSKSGRKCYLSGIRNDYGNFIASVRYLDDGTFVDVNYDVIKNKLLTLSK